MKRKRLILLLIFFGIISVFYSSCKKDEENLPLYGEIEGIVTHSQTGQPVQGVVVSISPSNESTGTGVDGKFNFSELDPKEYTIQAQKEGFVTNTKSVTVIAGKTVRGDITLSPIAPVLTINLTSLDFGSNLTTLPVEIRNIGAGTLNWNVVENINWLSVNPISGSTTTEVDVVNITVDRTSLSQGTYSQSISVTSDGGSATITINLIIPNPNAPTVTCATATNVSPATAQISGEITNIGSSNVVQRGHCWSTNPNPTTSNNITTLGPTTAIGAFTSNLTGLTPNTTYYIRAYATNSNGTGYSTDQIFTTTSTASVPSLTCDAANNITQTTADISGAITNLGTGNAIQHGHCWGTSSNPTTSNFKTTLGAMSSTGAYNSSLSNLSPNTTYYIRSYATNSAGTGYSNEVSFTTTTTPTAPSVTTGSITNITLISSTAGGSITNIGSSNVNQHGHCWSTNSNPTTTDNKTQLGTGAVGSFTSNISGLSSGTSYYVRAYATNSDGTSYGTQQSFTTLYPNTPTLSTTSASGISGNSASSGGSITSDGGAPILAKGVCWSTSANPTTSNLTTNDGTGSNSFSSSITGLLPMTTYYARAYATNSAGTSYGNQISFTTTHAIGESYGGGVIFYIDGTGQHGLIAATSDQATSNIAWGCSSNILSGADGTSVGSGQQNTNDIIAGCSESGIAARICSDLVFNGYSDWFLPSKDELSLMYNNKSSIGGFGSSYYWSSTEYNNSTNAWQVSFTNGNIQGCYKGSGAYRVRAIRAF